MKTKRFLLSVSAYFFLFFLLLISFSAQNIFAQTNQQITVGIESTTIFSLFTGYYTKLNSSYDLQVYNSLYSSLKHFHITPYLLFNYQDLLIKFILNYWENDDLNLMPIDASPQYLAVSSDLIYSGKSFDLGINQVLLFSINPGQTTSGIKFTDATYQLEDFYFTIKNIFSIIDITTGYSAAHFPVPLFRSVGPNSANNSYIIDPLSNNLYSLFLSVENQLKGRFIGWVFNGVNQTNYIDILITTRFFGFKLDLDFSIPYSQNANFNGVSFEDYLKDGLFKFHIGYSNDSIGNFNFYFQPYIEQNKYYRTGMIIYTYHLEKGEDLSSYFFALDYMPKLSFLKDLTLVISFDGWFDKEKDLRTSSRTGSGTVSDPYVYAFVTANKFSIGFDGRYKLDILLKGLSIDALFIYFPVSKISYSVTNAGGTAWTDYIATLQSNTNNLILSSYTEENYVRYSFYTFFGYFYKMKAFFGVSYQFSSFIAGLGFEYINFFGNVSNYLDFTNSNTKFPGRTDPKTPYGFFDRINIPVKVFYTLDSNLIFGIQLNIFFYPGFPDATELGYANFTQTNGTVVSAEEQYKLDVINLPTYQLNFIFQI
ncbi:MAG: hypothetical protein ACK4YF_07280, partial [Exilispira sp.]